MSNHMVADAIAYWRSPCVGTVITTAGAKNIEYLVVAARDRQEALRELDGQRKRGDALWQELENMRVELNLARAELERTS